MGRTKEVPDEPRATGQNNVPSRHPGRQIAFAKACAFEVIGQRGRGRQEPNPIWALSLIQTGAYLSYRRTESAFPVVGLEILLLSRQNVMQDRDGIPMQNLAMYQKVSGVF